jgi:nicotinate-nucleotide adenylyltransferase
MGTVEKKKVPWMSRIAVMGSAFNPPSLGHLDVIRQALAQCDRVWLVPSYRHAWGKVMAPYDFRCDLVRLFLQDIHDPRVRLCAIEHLLVTNNQPVYSYDVLNALQEDVTAGDELSLVIGPDNERAFDRFYKAGDIKRRWSLLVVEERLTIRSTSIRDALLHQQSVLDLTTPSVGEYLMHNTIYNSELSA